MLGAGCWGGTVVLSYYRSLISSPSVSRMQFDSTSYYHTIVLMFYHSIVLSFHRSIVPSRLPSSHFPIFSSSHLLIFSLSFQLLTFNFQLSVSPGHSFGNQYNKVCRTNIFRFYFIDFFLKLCCNSNYFQIRLLPQ